MTSKGGSARLKPGRHWSVAAAAALAVLAVILSSGVSRQPAVTAAVAAQPSVGLGTATSFAVLAGTTVTNTGPSVISGDLGVSPGTAITGFPPGVVTNGTQHAADAVALQAQADLTTAYNDAAGRTPAAAVSSDLGGQTLVAGVYQATSAMGLTGTVTFDGENNPDAVFIMQAGSTLITASSSTVALVRGAQACHVFWQVGSSATLGTSTDFVGTIMALTSVSVQTGTTVDGRVLARNGQVSLDTNVITRPGCSAATPSPTETPSQTPSETPSQTPSETPSETPSQTPSETPSETPSQTPSETPSETPSQTPSETPSQTPSETPSETPSQTPSEAPSETPSQTPSQTPSETPSQTPSETPSETPSQTPSQTPSETPTLAFGDTHGDAVRNAFTDTEHHPLHIPVRHSYCDPHQHAQTHAAGHSADQQAPGDPWRSSQHGHGRCSRHR